MKHTHLRPYGILGAVLVAWSLTACTPTISTRGNTPNKDALATIQLGTQTRDDVLEIIGSPSTRSTFDDRTWYYISEKTSKVTFYNPEIIGRKIVAIDFNEKGVVENIRQYGLRHGRVVEAIARKTPTPGKEPSAIDKLIGGFGDIS